VRFVVLAAIVLTVAACGDSNNPTGTKPPATSFDTLGSGSIAPSGGTITVNKSGDPLNGLTLTVPSGAYAATLDITIGSTSNKNLPTANGMVPISPLVHVVTSAGGYAKGAITFKVPATIPANTFPVVVLYDSATGALEPMTTMAFDGTSVTAITGHLSKPTIPALSASRLSARVIRDVSASSTGTDSLFMAFGVYALPLSVLNQDWDTQFRPGVNDWEFPSHPTEGAPNGSLLGVAATELWYFNSQASATPLNKRFAAVRNASLSDTIGYHWTSVIDGQVSNQVNSFLSSAYLSVTSGQGNADSLQFDNIRASFAIPTLNAGRPLPVFVDLQNFNQHLFYYLIAYRTVGDQIYVADPVSPGDASLFLQLGSGGMTPYVNPNFRAGLSLNSPLVTQLGLAVALPALASSYPAAAAGTVGNNLFPASAFYSWAGQLYDTMYVVDTLRFWAQCASCQFGFTSSLSPAPAGNVESSLQLYSISNGLVTDSSGSLSANGLLITQASTPPGSQRVLGVPIASADAAGTPSAGSASRWLDWHQFTLANLQGTVELPTGGALVGDPDTLQVSFQPSLLPADVAYQWSFGDSTPTSTLQNNATVIHSYTKTGTFPITVKVIDNRNAQVIARADTTLNGANVELWVIQSLTFLYATINGARSDTAPPKLSLPITAGTIPTLVALNGPPFPGGQFTEAGFGFVSPPDSAQQWAQVQPIALAISGPFPPIDVFAYSNTGTATSGTITGKALSAHTGVLTNSGRSVNLTKNGSKLSGYIMVQTTGLLNGVETTGIEYDTVVATRVKP
jgi:PKD domain